MFSLVLLAVVGSTVWVGFDAQTRDFSNHSFAKSTTHWVLGMMLLWIVVLPMYLVARDKVPLKSDPSLVPPLPIGDMTSPSSAPPPTTSNTGEPVGSSGSANGGAGPSRAVNPVLRITGLALTVVVGLVVVFAVATWWPQTSNTVARSGIPIPQTDNRDAQAKAEVQNLVAQIESCLTVDGATACQARLNSEDVVIVDANNYSATAMSGDGSAMYGSVKSLGLVTRACAGTGCASVTW